MICKNVQQGLQCTLKKLGDLASLANQNGKRESHLVWLVLAAIGFQFEFEASRSNCLSRKVLI